MIPSLHEVAAQMSLKQFLWNMVRRHCLLITLAGEHLGNESPKSLLKLAVLYSIRERVKSQEFFLAGWDFHLLDQCIYCS